MTKIYSERFLLRELAVEDATERYLGWLRDPAAIKFITVATQTEELSDLRQYLSEKISQSDLLFLGIFEKGSCLHIGNIKYEPVDSTHGYAIMGILIGDPSYRGKGVGTEVLEASAMWLKKHRNINQILLGVSDDNIAGIKSYEKVGFKVADTPYIRKTSPESITMVWNL